MNNKLVNIKNKKAVYTLLSVFIVSILVIIYIFITENKSQQEHHPVTIVKPATDKSLRSLFNQIKIIPTQIDNKQEEEPNANNIVNAWESPYRVTLSGLVTEIKTENKIDGVMIEVIHKTGSWSAITDINGKYKLEIPYHTNAALLATKSGYADLFIEYLEIEPKNSNVKLDLKLQSFFISGYVKDVSLQPINNIEILAKPLGYKTGNVNDPEGYYRTFSDQNGYFKIAGLNLGKYLLVFISKRHASKEKQIELLGNEKELNVILEEGKDINGIVVTQIGTDYKPVSNVNLSLLIFPKIQKYLDTKSNKDGRFLFKNVPDILPLTIKVVSPYHKIVRERVTDYNKTIKIILPKSATLGGIVTYENGDVSEGMEVLLQNASIDPSSKDSIKLKTITNEQGEYFFQNAPSGRLHVIVKGEGAKLNGGYIQIRDGEHARFDIKLSSGFTISGEVLDYEGKKVRGAELLFFGKVGKIGNVITNSKGSYELLDIAPGVYSVFFDGSNRFKSMDKRFAVNDDTEINLTLQATDVYLRVNLITNRSVEIPPVITVELCNEETRMIDKTLGKLSMEDNIYLAKNLIKGMYSVRAKVADLTTNILPIELKKGGSEVSLSMNCGSIKIRIVNDKNKLFKKDLMVGIRNAEKLNSGCFPNTTFGTWIYHSVTNGEYETDNMCAGNIVEIQAKTFGYFSDIKKIVFQDGLVVNLVIKPQTAEHYNVPDILRKLHQEERNEQDE